MNLDIFSCIVFYTQHFFFFNLNLQVYKQYFSYFWNIFFALTFPIDACWCFSHLSIIIASLDCPHFTPEFTLYTNLKLFFTFVILNEKKKLENWNLKLIICCRPFVWWKSLSTLHHTINHIVTTVWYWNVRSESIWIWCQF